MAKMGKNKTIKVATLKKVNIFDIKNCKKFTKRQKSYTLKGDKTRWKN